MTSRSHPGELREETLVDPAKPIPEAAFQQPAWIERSDEVLRSFPRCDWAVWLRCPLDGEAAVRVPLEDYAHDGHEALIAGKT